MREAQSASDRYRCPVDISGSRLLVGFSPAGWTTYPISSRVNLDAVYCPITGQGFATTYEDSHRAVKGDIGRARVKGVAEFLQPRPPYRGRAALLGSQP
jgi:hypothetical protein